MLDEQTFGALDRDADDLAVAGQERGEVAEPGNVMTDLTLPQHNTGRIEHAELMARTAPVDTDEHPRCRHRENTSSW